MICLKKCITFIERLGASTRYYHQCKNKLKLRSFNDLKRANDLNRKEFFYHRFPLNGAYIHTSSGKNGREFYLDKDVELRLAEEVKQFPFAVHELEFKTCEEYNEFLYHTKKDESRSLAGIQFKVFYVDTQPNADSKTPTVLALHGTPGNHLDFKEIIQFLSQRGIRVIAPNFPGFGWTPTDVNKEFKHSYIEKTFFVKDFLSALQIPKVDMIVTHSAGAYPGLVLCSEFKVSKSLMFMNPGGLSYPRSLNRIMSYVKFHISMYRNVILRPLLLANLKLILVLSGFGNTNAHHMTVAFESLVNVNHDACRTCIQNLLSANFPVTMVYSESDRVVDKDQFEEYIDLFGGNINDANHYDKEGKLIHSVSSPKLFEAHIFDGGGHFVMKKYPETVNNITYQFLQKIQQLK